MSAPTDPATDPAAGPPADPAETALEPGLLAVLRRLATHRAARGLADDCAVLDWPLGLQLVATHDLLAEGVHFTPHCPPASIGWKLVAVNLSDLAAEGARPLGVLLGAGIGADRDLGWAGELVRGVGEALSRFEVPLLGGDTIRSGERSVLSLTAIGSVPKGEAIGRAGAAIGDDLWLSGDIGAAGLGLRVALGEASFGAADPLLLKRYRRPIPRLALGVALRGVATAMLDVSDGLLLDAARLAAASAVGLDLEGARIPLADEVRALGVAVAELATLGDDYELLFTAPPARRAAVALAAAAARVAVARIGTAGAGAGARLDGRIAAGGGFLHR